MSIMESHGTVVFFIGERLANIVSSVIFALEDPRLGVVY